MGSWDNGLFPSNFNWTGEYLYRKSSGEFFLHAMGGAASKYAAHVEGSNTWSADELIIPLSVDEAKNWAEDHLSGDTYEEIFGEVDESSENHTLVISLPPNTYRKIREMADKNQKSISTTVMELVEA